MDKQYENDRFDFENNCDKARKHALIVGSHCVGDLNVINLSRKEGIGRISTAINQVKAQIKALNRRLYVYYANDTDFLFDYFKTNGFLHDSKEWDLLQQAMILREKYFCLQMLWQDSSDWDNAQDMIVEEQTLHSNTIAFVGLWDSDRETLTLHRKKILVPHALTPLPTVDLKSFSIACSLSEEKLITAINWMNEKYHLLDPRSPVESLTRKIICPNWTNDYEKVYLGCKTNIFRDMVDCVKTSYKHFNYAHIGRSGLFFSKKENVLNESNISSAVLKNKEKKQSIEDIFK